MTAPAPGETLRVHKREAAMRNVLLLAALFISSNVATAGTASLACPKGDTVFTSLPADLTQVSAIVPLGNLNPAGHTTPTRHIYVYPKMTTPGDLSTAVTLKVLSPGKAELVAVEYHPSAPDWSLHIKPCKDISLYYFHIKTLPTALMTAIGSMAVGSVTFPGGMLAKPVSIDLAAGQFVGTAKTFDIGLHDFRKTPRPFVNQARYKVDLPVLFAAFPALGADPVAPVVAPRIIPQALYNRCAIDYFTPAPGAALTAKLADFDGAPLASGTPRCHSHMQDVLNTAQGNWWNDLDPVHDALFQEEFAIALVNWNVTPTVQLFSLNENVPGFTSALLDPGASPDDVNSSFEFPVREGPQRTNRRFAEITDDALYCYDLVRIHRGGPRLNAVILLQVTAGPGGPRTKLNIELVRTSRCPALPLPWTFGSGVAAYYR
ncbi:MAG: hypothetical protein HOP13_14965 [Alphaproteobacteria bacterium]|nr:hypothetical protein [Alphaproteobacteria bacterium]